MSGVEIRQRAASKWQRGSRRWQEGWPAPLYRASGSTDDANDSKQYDARGFSFILVHETN